MIKVMLYCTLCFKLRTGWTVEENFLKTFWKVSQKDVKEAFIGDATQHADAFLVFSQAEIS